MAGSGPYGNSAFAHSLVGFYLNFLPGELRFQFVRNVGGNQLYGCVRFQHVYAVLRQCQGKLTLVGFILEGDIANAILAHESASHVFFCAYIDILPELRPAFFEVVGPVPVAVNADRGAMPMGNALPLRVPRDETDAATEQAPTPERTTITLPERGPEITETR